MNYKMMNISIGSAIVFVALLTFIFGVFTFVANKSYQKKEPNGIAKIADKFDATLKANGELMSLLINSNHKMIDSKLDNVISEFKNVHSHITSLKQDIIQNIKSG